MHRLVGEGTRLAEADLFVGYATVKVRNVLGELEDFLDVRRPRVREGPAPPPPEGGASSGGSADKHFKVRRIRAPRRKRHRGSERHQRKGKRHPKNARRVPFLKEKEAAKKIRKRQPALCPPRGDQLQETKTAENLQGRG